MTVRTQVLAAATATTTLTTIYTVPTDRTAIVKTVVVGKLGTPAQTLTMSVLRGAVAYGLLLDTHGIGASIDVHNLYVALEPGDQLRVVTDAGSSSVWVSGVELAGVAPP